MERTCSLWFCVLTLLLFGCESSPQKPQQITPAQPAAPDSQTGRFALQRMIAPAHLWAGDTQPIRMKSGTGQGYIGHDGKSAFWQAVFASPSRQKMEAFSWSGVPPKGVDHGTEDTFNPGNRSTQPFDLAFLKVDSDKAYQVAQEHGGKQLLGKNPNQEVFYLLDWDPRTGHLRWHVIYGSSENNAQLAVIVDASTGDFVHKE
jgi:hypothetical protein